MTNKNLNLKLRQPVFFQTTDTYREDIKLTQTQPKKVSISNNYAFPMDYGIEEMIAQSKKYMQQDDANLGVFYCRIHADMEIKLEDPAPYLNKLEEVAVEIVKQTDKAIRSRDYASPIQSCNFEKSAYNLNQSLLEVRDSRIKELALYSGILIDGVSKPYSISISLLKPKGTNCNLDRLEKFYNAIREIHTKILE